MPASCAIAITPRNATPCSSASRQQVLASIALREDRRLRVPAVSYPPDLPITARKDEIVAAIPRHQVVVIAGETGSGKTTQIPKMCLEAGLGIEAKIGCTQRAASPPFPSRAASPRS